jgi:hypothetical protein
MSTVVVEGVLKEKRNVDTVLIEYETDRESTCGVKTSQRSASASEDR